MKKTITLKKNYEFKNTLKKGKYFSGELIEGFYLKNKINYNYIGIAISAKLCNAVKRNKIKRIIREVYKNLESSISSGNTFVFLYKKKANVEECTYSAVWSDMKNIFNTLGIYLNEKNIS